MDPALSHTVRLGRPTDRTYCGLHTLSVAASRRHHCNGCQSLKFTRDRNGQDGSRRNSPAIRIASPSPVVPSQKRFRLRWKVRSFSDSISFVSWTRVNDQEPPTYVETIFTIAARDDPDR